MATQTAQRLPEVEEFLARQPLTAVIGGEDVASANGETFTTLDPGTGQVLAEVYAAQPQDVDRAVQAATDAFARAPWARLPVNQRCHAVASPRRRGRTAQADHCTNRIARLRQARIGRPKVTCRTSSTRCGTSSTSRCTWNIAARCPSPGMRPGPSGSRGDRAALFSRGISRSCWQAGAFRPHWLPAIRSSSSRRKTLRCPPSIWQVWPRKWVFPTV